MEPAQSSGKTVRVIVGFTSGFYDRWARRRLRPPYDYRAGTPADRVNILREAYVKAMNHPELPADTKKARMDIEPVSGGQLQALVKRVMNQPPAVLKRVKKFFE